MKTTSTIRQFIRSAMSATLPRRSFLTRGPRCQSVCLTFDDGPHPEHTPAVLDVLKAEGVQATFFVVGRRVEQHREIVCRIVADGHALGHHTYTHGDPTRVSARELAAEVRETRRLLDQIVGQSSSLFRPPHGKLTPGKLWRLWLAGQTVVLWNVDPKDFARSSADELRMWFRDNPVRGGDIVLLHDNKPHAAAALPELIAGARRQGLTFGTALQWIA